MPKGVLQGNIWAAGFSLWREKETTTQRRNRLNRNRRRFSTITTRMLTMKMTPTPTGPPAASNPSTPMQGTLEIQGFLQTPLDILQQSAQQRTPSTPMGTPLRHQRTPTFQGTQEDLQMTPPIMPGRPTQLFFSPETQMPPLVSDSTAQRITQFEKKQMSVQHRNVDHGPTKDAQGSPTRKYLSCWILAMTPHLRKRRLLSDFVPQSQQEKEDPAAPSSPWTHMPAWHTPQNHKSPYMWQLHVRA